MWDTAGQERFQSLGASYYRGSDGAFLIYDVSRIASFNSLQNWLSEIQSSCPNIPIVIVGNKLDLGSTVDINIVIEWANKNNCLFGGEVSCKDQNGIGVAYGALYAEMYLEFLNGSPNSESTRISLPPVTETSNGCCGSSGRSVNQEEPEITIDYTKKNKSLYKIIAIGDSGVGKTAFSKYQDSVKVDLSEVKRLGYNPFISNTNSSTYTTNTKAPVPTYDAVSPVVSATCSKKEIGIIKSLITLQAADGTWSITNEFLKIIRCSNDKVSANIIGTEEMWATSLAIAYLIKLKADKDSRYQLIIQKARNAVRNTKAINDATAIKSATEFLKRYQQL